MKVALVVSMLVILGAVVFYLVQRQSGVTATATARAKPREIDPVTGAPWQTIAEVQS